MKFVWEIGALSILDLESKLPIVASLVNGLAETNLAFLNRKGLAGFELYKSSVRYEMMPSTWRDIPTCLMEGTADCKSLVAWRLAELRLKGEYAAVAHFVVQRRKNNHAIFHVQVKRASGAIEDPSKRCGMKSSDFGVW